MKAIELLLSAVLGATFLASAVPKLRHPKGFVLAVMEYRVLPPRISALYARLVPPLEVVCAVLVLAGVAVRLAAAVMAVLLVTYLIAVGLNLARGRRLDCHCFGTNGGRQIGWRVMAQDSALLLAAIGIVAFERSWLGVGYWSLLRLAVVK